GAARDRRVRSTARSRAAARGEGSREATAVPARPPFGSAVPYPGRTARDGRRETRVKGGYEEKTAIQRTRSRAEGPRTGPAFLTVLTGELVGTVFELPTGTTLIGRSDRAQVRLPDEGVSRRHAKIVREADGSAKLVDLDSTNGTYINGRRIHAEGLREGDRIRVGQGATLDFRYEYRDSGLMGVPFQSDVPIPVKRNGSDAMRESYDNLAGAPNSLGKVYSKQGQH